MEWGRQLAASTRINTTSACRGSLHATSNRPRPPHRPSLPDFEPEWYDAHHIIPLNEYADLQGLRDKFAAWDIDLNSLDNGVALPNRTGEGTGTPHADTQNNPEYVDKLLSRFYGVKTRDEALFTLGQIKQELRDDTFVAPKSGKP